jgi:hypothetical protein
LDLGSGGWARQNRRVGDEALEIETSAAGGTWRTPSDHHRELGGVEEVLRGVAFEGGEVDELQRLIRRHGRTIRVLLGEPPRKRRH